MNLQNLVPSTKLRTRGASQIRKSTNLSFIACRWRSLPLGLESLYLQKLVLSLSKDEMLPGQALSSNETFMSASSRKDEMLPFPLKPYKFLLVVILI